MIYCIILLFCKAVSCCTWITNKNLIILVLVLLTSSCDCVTSFKENAVYCKLTLYMITSSLFHSGPNFGSSLVYNLVNCKQLYASRRNTAQQTKSTIVGENCRNPFQIIVVPVPFSSLCMYSSPFF